MVRCAISDCRYLSPDPARARALLLEVAQRWVMDGIDLIQLREKDLHAGALLRLARELLQVVRAQGSGRTRLVINGRADVAVAAGADGVHLTAHSGELTPAQVRAVFAHAGLPAPIVSVSCHTAGEVQRAAEQGADFILYGPVFEKRSRGERVAGGGGLEELRVACQRAGATPVLALGGVTEENSALCRDAGAAGIAGIRLFLPAAGRDREQAAGEPAARV